MSLSEQHEPSAEDLFAHRLRSERERHGWSQTELARRMAEHGVSLHFSAINKIEQRDAPRPRVIRLNEAVAISEALGVPLWQMLRSASTGETALRLEAVRAKLAEASEQAAQALERAERLYNEAQMLMAELSPFEKPQSLARDRQKPTETEIMALLAGIPQEPRKPVGDELAEAAEEEFRSGTGKPNPRA
jgi:transcriptional regulator with XRE-family HTH domain